MVHKIMKGVEVLIISGGMYHIQDAKPFLHCITEKYCSSLHTVVLRMPFQLENGAERLLDFINTPVWLEALGLKLKSDTLRSKMSQKRTTRQTCRLYKIIAKIAQILFVNICK